MALVVVGTQAATAFKFQLETINRGVTWCSKGSRTFNNVGMLDLGILPRELGWR